MRNRTVIHVQSDFFLILALALFLVPVRWVLGWIIASFVHEFSHVVMMFIHKVRMISISIKPFGAVIKSEPMSIRQELFCALAGPFGGLTTIVFARIFPEITICAYLQSLFNLLPAYPLDGGRAIKCAVSHLWDESRAEIVSRWLAWIVFALLVVVGLLNLLVLRFVLFLPAGLLLLNIVKNSLQSRWNDSTIQSNLERT